MLTQWCANVAKQMIQGQSWEPDSYFGLWICSVVRQRRPTCHLRTRALLGNVPAHLMDEPDNLFHLGIVDLLGTVIRSMVVGVQASVEEQRRNTILEKWPLVAPSHQVRSVVVIAHPQLQPDVSVRALD